MKVTGKLKKAIFSAGVVLAVLILVLAGMMAHGVRSISAMPALVIGPGKTSTMEPISYADDPNKMVSDEDVGRVRNLLAGSRAIFGWYKPCHIDFESSTNALAFFTRRKTVLAVAVVKENNTWVVKKEYKVDSGYTGASDPWNKFLDDVSVNLP